MKCIVKGCTNHMDQGPFVGDLCGPCHTMLTEGKIGPTDSFLRGTKVGRHDLLLYNLRHRVGGMLAFFNNDHWKKKDKLKVLKNYLTKLADDIEKEYHR